MFTYKIAFVFLCENKSLPYRECVRNLDLRVQVHPEELWVSKQRVHILLEASKSAGAKADVPKIFGTRCTHANAFPEVCIDLIKVNFIEL